MDVTAAAVVAVFQTYAKMNPAGQWVERSEHLKRNELFELMSQTEYRRDAELWRTSETLGAAAVVIPRIRSTDY